MVRESGVRNFYFFAYVLMNGPSYIDLEHLSVFLVEEKSYIEYTKIFA